MIYSYFATHQGLNESVGFSCDDVVIWSGYKPNYNKNKINDKIASLITYFEANGFYLIDGDLTRNNFVKATLDLNRFSPENQFAVIYFDELEKIRDYDTINNDKGKIHSSILLLALSYIRVNLLRRHSDFSFNKGNKPEFCYRMYKDIEADIGISSRYISRAISILEELGILASATIPRWKDESNVWHTGVTLFVNKYKYKDTEKLDDEYDYKQELIWGEEYIRQKKYLKKKFNQNI